MFSKDLELWSFISCFPSQNSNKKPSCKETGYKYAKMYQILDIISVIAPQAQLLETAKSVGPEALFKQVVKFEQIDPL